MSAPLLAIRGLAKSFGGLAAVRGFDLDVGPNDIVGLVGPNGSGKTTVLNLVTAEIQADGRAHDIKILEPLPMGLSWQALGAIRKWRFKPEPAMAKRCQFTRKSKFAFDCASRSCSTSSLSAPCRLSERLEAFL